MAEPFIGEIKMVGFNFAPQGWAFCNGQLIQISQNETLFSLLSTYYGGDGRVTFGLPDLRGRIPLHFGQSTGRGLSPHQLGELGGLETNRLDVSQMPSHNHEAALSNLNIGTISAKLRASDQVADANDPTGNALANANRFTYLNQAPNQDMNDQSIEVTQGGTPSANINISDTGGNDLVNNMQPYLATNFCIALQGIYPSRS